MREGKILVTGGEGFIGSALIWALNERGRDDIIGSGFLGQGEKWKNLVPLRFEDYIDADRLMEALESDRLRDVALVLHMGACSDTTERDCQYLLRNNYEFTCRLASWALAGGRRFVYASSAATYGDGSAGMEDSSENLHRFRPLNMYGYSKHLFDLYARRQGWLDRIVGLKYFNVFGPNEGHKGEMRSVVHKAFEKIQKTGRTQLFKSERPEYRDGEQKRDFIYVKDAVDATLHLAFQPEAAGLFNIGTGQASTWIELVSPIFEVLGLPVAIDFVDLPEHLRAKYQYYTCANTSRLQASRWRGPRFTLDAAVKDYVSQYLLTGGTLQAGG